jgi:electron transfer flavoprotein beta subunit
VKIVVCLKQIPDPDALPSDLVVDPETGKPTANKYPLTISPFDENALEIALQLKDKVSGTQVVALSYGPESAEQALRKALSLLVDEAVLVKKETSKLEDGYGVARVLASAIRNTGLPDLILCGRQAGDWDAGIVGFLLAEELGLPCVGFVSQVVSVDGNRMVFKAEIEGGWQFIEAELPVLATVTNDESNVMRMAKIKDIMMAHRRKVSVLTLSELGTDRGELEQCRVHDGIKELYTPVTTTVCEFIAGESPEEKALALLGKLREARLV